MESPAARLAFREADDPGVRPRAVAPATPPTATADPEEVRPDPLLAACRLVASPLGLTPRPASTGRQGRARERLRQICEVSRIRYRRVQLREGWFRRDSGPLLGFRQPAGGGPFEASEADPADPADDRGCWERPVALLPVSSGVYDLVDPDSGERTRVDAAVAARLSGEAYMLYPSFGRDRVGAWDLVRMTLRDRRRDLLLVALAGIGGGLLNLAVPVATGAVYGRVLRRGEASQLLPLMLALALAAAGAAAFQVLRSLCVLRVTSRVDGFVQPAVWDRLLRLPAAFFRRHSVGDLANRVLGADTLREMLLADITTALLGLVVGSLSFSLLFYYSWRLALLALGLVLILGLAAWTLTGLQLRHRRDLLEIQGRISDLLFDLLQGIAKLRGSGAERRAYARWAWLFAEQRRSTVEGQRWAHLQNGAIAVYALVAEICLFAAVGWALREELTAGRFLAFSAAFGQAQAAVIAFLAVVPELQGIVPVYERLRPILEEELEVSPGQVDAGSLEGAVEVRRLSFRYAPEGPRVLDDVSLRIGRGELVALVGASGSGKSTLLRLLLGFERPEVGAVLYDGKDLASLDPESVRRQIGVVLQNSRPMTGDLYTNIAGAGNLGTAAAWEAARQAGLEEDIRAMPMGLHTIVGEGGTTFSGGQQQRLMIARALAGRPRMLFLDEATSALDNPSQEWIRESLATLAISRLVIAHRLSTIRSADRIYVLDRGRLVEEGTYDELMRRGGHFARLAQRQLSQASDQGGLR